MRIPESILNAATTFSEVYSLFPQETLDTPTNVGWPDNCPLAGLAGVYLIFGATMQLLYVGKSGALGSQLSNYFRWSAGRLVEGPRGTKILKPIGIPTWRYTL